jgi:hypothetical protein
LLVATKLIKSNHAAMKAYSTVIKNHPTIGNQMALAGR